MFLETKQATQEVHMLFCLAFVLFVSGVLGLYRLWCMFYKLEPNTSHALEFRFNLQIIIGFGFPAMAGNLLGFALGWSETSRTWFGPTGILLALLIVSPFAIRRYQRVQHALNTRHHRTSSTND